MSSLLDQAIVDATALKEAAIKNAESAIIEKYSEQIKEAIDELLEQDEELGLGDLEEPAAETSEFVKQIPSAATDGEDLCPCPDEDEEVEIDFDELAKQIEAEDEMGAEGMVDREEFAEEELGELEEDIDIDESLLLSLLEETFEIEEDELQELAVESPPDEINEEEEELNEEEEELEERTKTSDVAVGKDTGGRRVKNASTGQQVSEKLDNLQESLKKVLGENKTYKNLILKLKEKLDEVSLSNAQLLYKNRVLSSASLNERQKNKLVEAISKAATVEEAKIIYETLQSSVGGSSQKRTPKSLNEVVSKNSLRHVRQKQEVKADSTLSRMQVLAGINRN